MGRSCEVYSSRACSISTTTAPQSASLPGPPPSGMKLALVADIFGLIISPSWLRADYALYNRKQ